MSDPVGVNGVAEVNERNKYSKHILLCVCFTVSVVGISGVLQSFLKVDNCLLILDDGYWTGDGWWNSNWCIMHQYEEEDIATCLNLWERIIVIGGNAAKEYSKLLEKHLPKKVEFLFHPTLKEKTFQEYQRVASQIRTRGSILVLHRPEVFVSRDDLQVHGMKEACRENLNSLQGAQRILLEKLQHQDQVILMTPEVEMFESKSDNLVKSCLQLVRKSFNDSQPLLKYLNLPVPGNSNSVRPLFQELNLLSNSLCNSPEDSTCCVDDFEIPLVVYMAISLILAVLAFYLGVYLIFASGATFALTPYLEARSFDLNKFFIILHSVGGVAATLFYMQMTDRLDYFIRMSVHPQYILCGIFVLGFIVLAMMSIRDTGQDQVLSPDQCNEWRGWMMILFISIRYFGFEKVFIGPAIIDFVTGGFLFLCGYCHFSNHLHSNGSATWKKDVQVLVAMNFIPVCVCISLNSSYGFYFLLPLLSMSYIFVVIFIKSWPTIQASPVVKTNEIKLTALKFLIFGFLLSLFPFFKDYINSFVQFDKFYLVQFEKQRFIPLWGMVVAYVFHVIKSNYSSTISKNQSMLRPLAVVSGISIFLAFVVISTQFQSSFYQTHFSILPLLAYVLLRNGFSSFQSYTSSFLKEVGTVSVWLFVSHYHILMAFDGRGLLVLLPGFHVLNTLLVVLVYVIIAFIVHSNLQTLKSSLFLFVSSYIGISNV